MRVGGDFWKQKMYLYLIFIYTSQSSLPLYYMSPIALFFYISRQVFTLVFPFSMSYGIIHSKSITPSPPAAFLILCAASSKFNDIRFSLKGTGPRISSAVKKEVEYPVVTEK